MGDNMPNYTVEQQRLKAKIASQEETIARQQFEINGMTGRAQDQADALKAYAVELSEKAEAMAEEENELEVIRLTSEIARLRKMIEHGKLAIMELADRNDRLSENINSAQKSIGDERRNLSALEETHGKATDADFEKALKKLLG